MLPTGCPKRVGANCTVRQQQRKPDKFGGWPEGRCFHMRCFHTKKQRNITGAYVYAFVFAIYGQRVVAYTVESVQPTWNQHLSLPLEVRASFRRFVFLPYQR